MGGIGPRQFQVDISGIANDECQDCGDLNGTYVLQCRGTQWPAGYCLWRYEFPAPVCGLSFVDVWVGFWQSTLKYNLFVRLTYSDDQAPLVWGNDDYQDRIDCLALEGESLPLYWVDQGWNVCDPWQAEVTVTALAP